MQAASTFEALKAWRKLVGDDKAAVENLRLIINERVLRKLCNACKVGYTPDPNTLRKLGMNPDKSTTLFQARTQPLRGQFLQEEALGLVEKGDTSVQEVLRVMKGGDAAPQPQEPATV